MYYSFLKGTIRTMTRDLVAKGQDVFSKKDLFFAKKAATASPVIVLGCRYRKKCVTTSSHVNNE